MNFIAKYNIKGATPVKIKTNIFLTLNKKLSNTHNNLKDKGEKLDFASITQLYDSYLSQKLIIIDKITGRNVPKAVSFSCFV